MITAIIYTLIKWWIIKTKFNLQPYDISFVRIAFTAIIAYLSQVCLPQTSHPIFDILLKGTIGTIIFTAGILFQKIIILRLKDGKIVIVTKDSIQYTTLSNGKKVATSFPGQIEQVPIDENETYLRQNFDKSDNVNYRDGDKLSSRFFNVTESESETKKGKDEMYNSPKHNVSTDSLGNMIRKYDKSNKRTTLINDNVRVYKGGSWKDRAYWLDPAQRRYLPQDMATDYIGFRCAMSRVGPKSDKRKTAKN
jgi:gliding motility-associated lipoprotein GldJ